MRTPSHLSSARARSTRPIAPRCRNGVSSLLRLSQVGASRLPAPQSVSDWVERAAGLLGGPEFVIGAPR